MNIYDLEKQATPAQWKLAQRKLAQWKLAQWKLAQWKLAQWKLAQWKLAAEEGDDRTGGQYALMTEDGIDVIAHTYGLKEDMMLAAHCRNNFLKALETLKKCRDILDSEYPKTDERHPGSWGLDSLIAGLEAVK